MIILTDQERDRQIELVNEIIKILEFDDPNLHNDRMKEIYEEMKKMVCK